jgi:hypothetical protein
MHSCDGELNGRHRIREQSSTLIELDYGTTEHDCPTRFGCPPPPNHRRCKAISRGTWPRQTEIELRVGGAEPALGVVGSSLIEQEG